MLGVSIPTGAEASPKLKSKLEQSSLGALKSSGRNLKLGKPAAAVVIALNTDSGTKQYRFKPVDIRAKNYKSEFTDQTGTYKDKTEVLLFAGRTNGSSKNNFSRLAIIKSQSGSEEIRGLLAENGRYYAISAEDTSKAELALSEMKPEEVKNMIAHCGAHLAEQNFSTASASGLVPSVSSSLLARSANGGIYKQADIATEADYEYYLAHGSSASSANAAILAVLNSVSGIYESELGITLNVTYQHSWTTSSDPYSATDPVSLLNQFYQYWENNYSAVRNYDLAHLWTGRDLDGGVVGVAYLGTVCNSHRYGLSQFIGMSSYDIPLAAHEIGHNFGADHDNCDSGQGYIMCPYLVQNSNSFSAASKSDIGYYVNTFSCLSYSGSGGNSAPVLGTIGPQNVDEFSTLNINLTATDAENNPLSFSFSPMLSGMSLSGSSFSYTPPGNVVRNGDSSKTINVTFSVSDGTSSDSETVSIRVGSVNQTPSFPTPAPQNIAEGDLLSYQAAATDSDEDSLYYSAPYGLPPGATLSASGLLSWRPLGNQAGSYSLILRARDNYWAYADATLTINVSDTAWVSEMPAKYAPGNMSADTGAEAVMFNSLNSTFYANNFLSPDLGTAQGLGERTAIPLLADLNGDKLSDYLAYLPSSKRWSFKYSGSSATGSLEFGKNGGLPFVGDFDGDGRQDLAIYSPAESAVTYHSSSDGSFVTLSNLGRYSSIPFACDLDGDGKDEAITFNGDGSWTYYSSSSHSLGSAQLGQAGDLPLPAYYDTSSNCQLAVFRPSNATWHYSGGSLQFGAPGDIPVSSDYNGDGKTEFAVYRPSDQNWYFRDSDGSTKNLAYGSFGEFPAIAAATYYALRNSALRNNIGSALDSSVITLYDKRSAKTIVRSGSNSAAFAVKPDKGASILSGDYNGDGAIDLSKFKNGQWTNYLSGGGTSSTALGVKGDRPLSGDFDGDGITDIAVFRPQGSSSLLLYRSSREQSSKTLTLSAQGDLALVADFNGDGVSDIALYRSANFIWSIFDVRAGVLSQTIAFGARGLEPRAGDFDGDGRADLAVFNKAGLWYFNFSSGRSPLSLSWGGKKDVPLVARLNSPYDTADIAVFRPSTRLIYVRSLFGQSLTLNSGLGKNSSVLAPLPTKKP